MRSRGTNDVAGALLFITHTTDVKWWLSFENPAQNHSEIHSALTAGIQNEAIANNVTAVELVNPFQTIPIHYNTFPAVETDAAAFKQDVEQAGFSEVLVLEPGATHTIR